MLSQSRCRASPCYVVALVVERTFAWVGRYRRMSKDYEYLPASSEAMLHLVMMRLMLRRLALKAPDGVPSRQRLGLKR